MNGIILAGGKNSRIGTRKAFLEVNGQPIIERSIKLMRPHFDQLYLITNEPDRYEQYGLPMVFDEIKEVGPLGGIHAGLGASDAEYNFVVACDMPFLEEQVISHLLEEVAAVIKTQDRGNPYSCFVPRWQKGIEPLHAIYHKSLRQKIEEALAVGDRKMGYLVRVWQAYFVDLDSWAQRESIDLGRAFANVNTWEEFNQVQERTK